VRVENGVELRHKENPVTSSLSPEADLENRKIRRLRGMVDLTSMLLRQSDLPLADAVRLVMSVRERALELFPGKEQTYDLIYAPRFARILQEKYGIEYPES
jgi:hypothetical protein